MLPCGARSWAYGGSSPCASNLGPHVPRVWSTKLSASPHRAHQSGPNSGRLGPILVPPLAPRPTQQRQVGHAKGGLGPRSGLKAPERCPGCARAEGALLLLPGTNTSPSLELLRFRATSGAFNSSYFTLLFEFFAAARAPLRLCLSVQPPLGCQRALNAILRWCSPREFCSADLVLGPASKESRTRL